MIKRLWRIILFLTVLAVIHTAFSACAPQKRLNRLMKHHPELGDTIKKTVNIELPGFRYDTSITYSHDTTGLAQILSRYHNKLDSLSRIKLTKEIHNYIINRPMLDGPVSVPILGGGKCTITPVAGGFIATVSQEPRKVSVTVPQVIFNYQSSGPNWKHIAFAFLAGWGSLAAIIIVIMRVIKKKGGANG